MVPISANFSPYRAGIERNRPLPAGSGSITWCIPEHSQHGTSISKVLKDFVHDRVEVLHVSHFERTPPMLSFCHFFEPARQAYQGDSSSWRTLTIVKRLTNSTRSCTPIRERLLEVAEKVN